MIEACTCERNGKECRVAILNRGELQGCGELHEILSLGAAMTELTLENPPESVWEEVRPLAASVVRTGDRVRLEISDEDNIEKVLAIALRNRVKVVSLNPVKMSLEDYFLAKVAKAEEQSGPRA